MTEHDSISSGPVALLLLRADIARQVASVAGPGEAQALRNEADAIDSVLALLRERERYIEVQERHIAWLAAEAARAKAVLRSVSSRKR